MAPHPATSLKVLHISGRSDHGGGPEHILQVIGADLPGITHHVACPESGVYWGRYRARLGAEHLCPIPHRSLSLPAMLRLRAFVRANGIQVIHSHGMCGGVYGRALGVLTGLPVVHTFHGVPVTPGLKHRLYHTAERALSRLTDVGIAVSAGEADVVHDRWRRYRGRLAVVPNGIGVASEAPEWTTWPAPGAPLRIVSFSRRNQQKNPELLLDIAARLHAAGQSFRIDAWGEGLDHPGLQAAVARRGLSGQLAFHPPTDDPAAVLTGANVYLSTSRWEGMPLSVLEAWRAGLVVVASDVVGNRDLVREGRTGWLYPPNDAAAAALRLGALHDDPELVERVRRRAARIADRDHAHDLMGLRLAWVYRQAKNGLTDEEVPCGSHVEYPDDESHSSVLLKAVQ